MMSTARSKPSGSRRTAISASARWRSWALRLRWMQLSRKRRRSSPPASWWIVVFARRQPFAATRAPASAAQACCSSGNRYSTAIRHSSRSNTRSRRSGSLVTGTMRRSTRRRRPRPRRTGPDDDRAAAVDVAVEQLVQRHDRLVVRGRRVHEVDDDARLLARVAAGDATDALLVDALRSGRREVHADGRARRVPALGEQHRVDEHVDLAALERGQDARQLALGRLARDRLRLHAGVLERLRDVVRVLHAGAVDDAGQVLEAHAVQVRDGGVERPLVEQCGQLLLVEVLVHLAFAQRHVGKRAHVAGRAGCARSAAVRSRRGGRPGQGRSGSSGSGRGR